MARAEMQEKFYCREKIQYAKTIDNVHRKIEMKSAEAFAILRSQGQRSTPTEKIFEN